MRTMKRPCDSFTWKDPSKESGIIGGVLAFGGIAFLQHYLLQENERIGAKRCLYGGLAGMYGRCPQASEAYASWGQPETDPRANSLVKYTRT